MFSSFPVLSGKTVSILGLKGSRRVEWTWTTSPAHCARRKSKGPAFHPELHLGPRSLASAIALVPLGRFGAGLLGTAFLPAARQSPCGYWQDSPLLASVGITPAPHCLESICPQHCLESLPCVYSMGVQSFTSEIRQLKKVKNSYLVQPGVHVLRRKPPHLL